MDLARVLELYAPAADGPGGQVGSGYLVSPGLALTAAHVVAAAEECDARPLGASDWVPATVAWRNVERDVAVLRVPAGFPEADDAGMHPARWGRIDSTEQVAVTAVGFPWAQERPDGVRDTEQLFGFIAPASSVKSGHFEVTVQSSPPLSRAGGSPWAGMSGAALFAGPFLVAMAVIDPPRFGSDRVTAAPIAPLLSDPELAGLLGFGADALASVGPSFRLAVTKDVSIALLPPYQPPTPRLGREQARLLLPKYGIVPFAGRTSDLEELQSWCLDDTPVALRVVTGSGGSGKTRLAAETCVRMAERGWLAGFADPDAPGGQEELTLDRPTLVVVDDADLNVDLLTKLMGRAGTWSPYDPRLRLLLLARHITGWWDTLNQSTKRLAAELADEPMSLQDGELTVSARAEHHARAVAAFAARLRTTEVQELTTPLTDPAFANPLLVHMHALLMASGATVPAAGENVRERILDAVLDNERDRWTTTFPAAIPTGGARTRQQAVTVATLLTPPTEHATAQAVSIVEDFQDAPAGSRAAVATWLRELYPGENPPWVQPLRPDLLAEQLLASCEALSTLVLGAYNRAPERAEQILTELTRAEPRPPVHDALSRLLDDHLADLLARATDSPSSQLPSLLELALTRVPKPALATALLQKLPARSTGLAALAATLTTQAVDNVRDAASAGSRTASLSLPTYLNNLSNRLYDVGRREDALAAIQESVALYRDLAAARPDDYTSRLAGSLNNLCSRLASLGRLEDALEASQESVMLYRKLSAARPGEFARELARALNNMSNGLGALGRKEDALAASQDAVAAWRLLASADTAGPDLAGSLNNLSTRLGDLGRRTDALAASEESVALYRTLAATRYDALAPDFANALNGLSVQLGALSRPQEALAASEEAITIRRQLAATRPDAFTPALATSLNNVSVRLAELGRLEDALSASQEAVAFYRTLAAGRPNAFNRDFAAALNNLSTRLGALGHREDALTAGQEAVALYRTLAAARPNAFNPDFARSLNNVSVLLAAVGRRDDALAAVGEAVELYQTMSDARPEAFTPALATALANLSGRLAELGRHEDALVGIKEAIRLQRQLADTEPKVFTADLAKSLHNFAVLLTILGRHEEAQSAMEEAITLRRQLVAAGSGTGNSDLAISLLNSSLPLAELGRRDDALAAVLEALALYRQLFSEHPAAFRGQLVRALSTAVVALRGLGKDDEAAELDQELQDLPE